MRCSVLLGITLALLTPACVTKAKHDATLRDLAAERSANQVQQRAYAEVEQRLTADGHQLTDLKVALADEKDTVSALTATRVKLMQELTRVNDELASQQQRANDAEQELAKSLKTRARLEESVDRVREALAVLTARQVAAEGRLADYRDLVSRFEGLIDAGTLDVRVSRGRMVLTLPADVLFPSGSAGLSTAGKETIAQVGATLATLKKRRFQVEGHTDDAPIHTDRFPSNWELASARALVVVHTLLAAGMSPTQVSAASFGEFEPRAANRDASGRASNRRIEIVVVPDLGSLPGSAELEKLTKAP